MKRHTFSTKYGSFSADGREYIITTPATPRPWINVISNGDYGVVLSQTGSGYSWRTHAQLNRLTRWEQDLIKDEWGKYIYIRDEKENLWSAGWKPVCHDPDFYECRHGIGYSAIRARNFGIETELLLLVPQNDPLEVWRLTVRNRSRRPRRLRIASYLEWGLGQAPDWHREFHKSFVETSFDKRLGAIFATKRLWEVPTDRGHWNTDWPYVAFHGANPKPASFDTDKESFIGMYRGQAHPAGLDRRTLAGHTGKWLDPCASLQHEVRLRPGQETTIIYTLGCADSHDHAREIIQRYRTAEDVTNTLGTVAAGWERRLETVTVSTPDPALNLMENVWLKYQAISGRIGGRTAYYQTGGAFGFRDQLQDSQIWLPIEPEKTNAQLRLHARHQFADGTVYHWWHPLSEIGLRNDITDNLLWLPFVTNAYLQETADFALLDVAEPFIDQPTLLPLYDHCTLAIDKALSRFSPRGLPLIGSGDWNDGLSAVGLDWKGESVWLGHFLHKILVDFGGIALRRGDQGHAAQYRLRANDLRDRLNSLAWDGLYYLGATKDSGEKLGSRENAEGSLWLNPQTWAIIAGVADNERARIIFEAIEENLEKEIGPLLLMPAYKTPDKYVGYLTRYSPGVRENGGVYTHAATWAVIAAALLGRGEAAHRIFTKLNPIIRGRKPDRYCAEPYVTPGNIEGPDSPFFGRGGWTWYTGSAAWLFTVGLEWILGIRPTVEGLLVDPCIPASWDGFGVIRMFRGARFEIQIQNPDHVEWGVAKVLLDGTPVCTAMPSRGKTLPIQAAGTEHEVVVVMGKP